jgi:hypothetical protein
MSYKNDKNFDIRTDKIFILKTLMHGALIFMGPSGKITYLKVLPCLSKAFSR